MRAGAVEAVKEACMVSVSSDDFAIGELSFTLKLIVMPE